MTASPIVSAALDRGYTLDEVANKLSEQAGLDPATIRARGYDSAEILAKLGHDVPPQVPVGGIEDPSGAEPRVGAQQVYATKPNTQGMKFDEHGQPIPMGMDATVDKQIGGGTQNAPTDNATALAQRLSSNPTSPTIADAKELALSNPASPENRDRVAADNASELGVQIQQDQADRDFHQESINTGMHWNYDKQTTVQHYLHQISQGELDSETLGLAPQFNLPPQSGGEEVARAAGDLAGFIGGPGLFAAKGAVGLIGGLEHVYGESVVKALAKDVIAQSATLGLATGLGATGEALRADNWQDATKIIAKATASGEGMGAIFGAFARIFPDNTIPQFLGRMVGINTAMDLAGGTNPTDNRSLEKKFYDYGLNSWFALRGAGRTEGGWIHDKASTTQEHADIIDKVGVGNPDVGIDDAIAAAHTAVDEPLAKDRTVAQILSDFQQKKPLPEVRNGTGDEGANDAASVRGSVPGGNNNGEGILPDGVRLPAGGNLGEQGGISATDAGAGRQGVAMEGQDANLPDAADKGNGVQPGLQDATANTELGRRDYELHGQTITSDELDAAIQQHKDWLASNHIEHRAQPEENGEAAHAASINEGAGKSLNTDRPGGKTAEFFTKMTLGEDGKPGAEYTPTLDLSGHQEFMDEYGKHRGNFDNHIRASIPGFGEVQVKTGDAIRQAYPKGARVLDIGASEGSWAKTISSLSGGKIKTDSLEPLESMADHFKNISTVPGAKHYAQAWGDEGWTEPNGFEVKPFKVAHKYDVVHEAMTFQFIDNNRQEQIARAKDAMKPSGVLMLEEKFANDGTPEYAQREAQKDEYKGKYFTKTAIADKAKDTLVVGMNDSMAKRQALEDVLASKFKYVKQYWSAGNFGGYAASDSKAALDKLVDKVGDTNSKYSGQQTPRDVTGRDVMINVGLKTTDGKGITEAQVRDELDKLGIGISKAAVHPPQYDGDEEKFAARISRPLTPEEAHQFSADLNQEAITQVVDGKGELYGPNAEGWKPYQAKYFTKPEGGQLSHPEIVGTHFSTERRDVLSGEFNGSGLKGRDAARLLFNEDPRINTRLSFYVDEGNGVHPEAGVGNVRHDVKLNNLYDAGKDPLKLRASGMQTEEQANAFESAVLDHGFSGYYIKGAFSKQGAAVLLGDAAKDVRPEGGVQMSVSAKQTETPAFKEWFGDTSDTRKYEHSVVTNEDGTPRIMYHSTSADFNAFKRRVGDVGMHFGTQGQAEDRGQYVRGNHPEALTGANTIPVYLDIRNPLRMEDAGFWNADNMVWVLKKLFPTDFKTRAEMRHQTDYTRSHPEEITDYLKHGFLVTTKDIREYIQSKGYDGIVYKNTGEVGGLDELRAKVKELESTGDALAAPDSPRFIELSAAYRALNDARTANQEDSYIAFERNQIKSALGNNGDFNSRKPDITKSQGEHSLSTEESEYAKQRAHPDEIPFTTKESALASLDPKMRDWSQKMMDRAQRGLRGGLHLDTEENNLQRAAEMSAKQNGTTVEAERAKLNKIMQNSVGQADRDMQVHRLQDKHNYSREDALRDYMDGTRIDDQGKEYRVYFSKSTIMQRIGDILHNPSQSLIDKDIALNKLLGGGDETISARVGQAKDTNWVAKQISGLLDWADPGHIERALENIRKSPLYSRGVHVNAFYHPDIGQIFVNTDRVSNHDVPGIILHEVSHAANNDKLNSEVMHRLNVAEAIQHGFLGPQKSVVDSDGNEIMYSPLKRMLGELQQNKGTPEQWEGILNNFKQKGIKPDELENTQILDQIEFLKDHNVKVIKKEDLMKWLEEHEINVEPHIYGYGGQGGGGTPEFEFRYGNWATEEPDDYWLQERGREQLGEMSPDDLRQQIEDMNEEQPSDEEIEKLQNQYGWNNRVRIEEYKDVTGTMAAEGKKFSVLRNGEVLKDFTTKAKAEKYVESILPNADTMALKEKLEEAAYEKERGYYYQDDESPAYRNISVMAGEDNYHFQHRMGYGDHEIYDSLLGNTLELGNTRRFDDADLESALRQHLMEKYDVYEGDEEGSPKYDDEDYNLPGGDEYRETVLAQKGKSGEHYNKGHFSVRDQIAHERADMREVPVENIEKEFPDLAAKLRATGDTHARIYFIQEHQADRAHEGREKPTVQVPYTHEDLKVNEAASSGDPEKLARYEVRKVVGPNDDLHHEPRYAVFEKSTTASPTEGRAISRLEYSKEDAAVQRLVLAGGERWIIDADNHDGTHSEMSRNKQDYPTRQDAINSLIKEERAGVVKGKLTAFEATKKANALQKQLSKISQQMEDNTSAYKDADRTMVAEYDAQRDQIPADQFNQRDALRKAFQTKQDELAERHAISRNALSEQQHPLSDQLSALPRDRAVPGAYVESTDAWEKLLFQHAIVQAKKEGAHLIAWTTADQQTARWSGGLRKKVDTIEWDKSADGQIHIRALQGRSVRADTRYGENDLSAAIGKTMARRIIEDPNQSGKIEGKDIVVADLGMSKVYGDSAGNAPDGKPAIMAKVANQLLKQMGGDRVQEANLRPMKYGRIADETEVSLQPAFEITNKMGEAVDKGLPQFSKQSSAQGDIYARVRARMEASGEVGNSKEATSYLVEEAMNMGRTAGHSRIDAGFWAWATKALPASVVNTLRQWVAAVRAAMFRNGIVLKEKDLTVDDFVAVAKANMHDLATGKMDAAGGKEPVTGSVQSPVLDKRAEAITELHAAKDRMDKLERMDVPEFDGTTPELHDARSQYNAAAKAAADLGVDVQDELHNPDIRMSKSGPKFVKRDDVLDEKAPGVLAKVGSMVGAIKTGLGELKNAYLKEPEFTESKRIIGKYIGALQEIDFDLSKIAKEINLRVPADRQVAITNYMQAGGDEAILKQRATTGFPEHRKGYEDALTLTPVEKQVADFIQGQLDIFWRKANEAGILEGYVENYVRGQWQKENSAGQKTMAIVSSGMLNDKPREAMRKVFQNYFEGEQLGFVPVDKRIGYQFVAGQRSIRAAIAARQALTDMMHATEKDGRPMVAVGGGGSMIGEDSADKPYFVKPNIKPADSADYKSIDHPAMRKWKWVGSDDAGKPIMMQGNMYIHPEAYGRLNALLGRSAIRSFEVPKGIPLIGGTHPGDAALKAGAFVKGTILIGPFHQFHLGEHAVFHGVNPLDTPEIDFDKRPLLREGVEHGLMLYNYNAMFEFAEGLASGGLLHKLPYAGDALRSYQEWLFQDYIPRLKAEMFEHAVKRAEIYYAKDLASGKFTRDQLLDNAAKQGNAAFGELNYKYMGRNPTYQDALRIALLAPDFLEARFKFAGQAVRPRGKEQAMAFIRGGLIMGLGAQTINAMFGDDKDKVDAANRWSARAITNRMHWDRPFSVVINGREYSPRSVPADMLHLITDPRGFWYNRINPLWGKPVLEIATGKDINGQTESLVDGIKSILTGFVPIPVQGAIRNNQGQTQLQAVTSTLLQSIGVSNFPAKTAAEKLVGNIAFGHRTLAGETEQKKKKYNDYADLKNDYMDGKLNSMDEVLAKARAGNMLISKPMMASIKASRDTSPEGKVNLMEHRMRSFTGEEVLQVFEKMDDSERAAYKPFVLSKIAKSSTMTGPEKLEAIRQVQSK